MHQQIVACARGWIGTRFHHQGRLRKTATHKGGVDCLGLLVGVAAELDLRGRDGRPLAAADEADYPNQPDTRRLIARLSDLISAIPPDRIDAGDVVLCAIDGHPQHLAISTGALADGGIIHAYAPARAVVEHRLDEWWTSRLVAAFRIS